MLRMQVIPNSNPSGITVQDRAECGRSKTRQIHNIKKTTIKHTRQDNTTKQRTYVFFKTLLCFLIHSSGHVFRFVMFSAVMQIWRFTLCDFEVMSHIVLFSIALFCISEPPHSHEDH